MDVADAVAVRVTQCDERAGGWRTRWIGHSAGDRRRVQRLLREHG
jgi:hypothetical protein